MPLLPILLAATTLLPGLWEYKTSLAGFGGDPERKCLSKAQIDRFLTNPSNRHYDCDYATREVAGGRVRLAGVCANRKHAEQRFDVSLQGAYTDETITLKGVARVPLGAVTLPLGASVAATRVSAACTPEPATP